MTPELAAFSDWALALLPRLFIYPGGLWLAAALLLFRFTSGGRKAISGSVLLTELSCANLLSVAVAWVAIALAPLPGASALPSPPDSLVLAALPALSLLLDTPPAGYRRLFASAAITLALLLPSVGGGSLLAPAGDLLLLALSSFAVLAALASLSWSGSEVAGQVRWLAWFCLGAVPLWEQFAGNSAWGLSLFLLVGILALNLAPRLAAPSFSQASTLLSDRLWLRPSYLALAIAWLLALPGLLLALLAG